MDGYTKKNSESLTQVSVTQRLFVFLLSLKKAIKNSLTGWYITWVCGSFARLVALGERAFPWQSGAQCAYAALRSDRPLRQMELNGGSGDSLMLFGDEKTTTPQEPKKQSLLGRLFNPRVDREIEPMKESARMFVRFVASVFASYGLFPKEHPAINDMGYSLTLRQVIGVAYGNLTWDKKNLPQILAFLGVVGAIAIVFFTFFLFFLSLFVSPAQAQIFQNPYPGTDWGTKWIEYLFLGVPITGEGATPTTSCDMQKALGQAIGFYSTAILVFAGVILLYHLVSMVVETAHTGEALGKRANKIWAPIRLVIAIGLLVPIASGGGTGGCFVGGYNTGQYIVIQVAKWGSGLASNGWKFFLTSLNQTTSSPTCSSPRKPDDPPSCVDPAQNIVSIVKGLISNEACAQLYQHYLKEADPQSLTTIYGLGSLPVTPGPHYLGLLNTNGLDGGYEYLMNGDAGRICGGYEVPPTPVGPYAAVHNAQLNAFQAFKPRIVAFVDAYKKYAIYGVGNDDPAVISQARAADLDKMVRDFNTAINLAVSGSIGSANTAADKVVKDQLASSTYTSGGWLMAGAWFNTIARMQAHRSAAIRGALPIYIKPKVLSPEDAGVYKKESRFFGPGRLKDVNDRVADKFTVFNETVQFDMDSVYISEDTLANAAKAEAQDDEGLIRSIFKNINPVNGVLKVVDYAGGKFGAWNDGGTLAIKFGSTQNPLAELSALGQNYVEASTWLVTAGSIVYGLANSGLSFFGAAALDPLASLIFLIAGLLFTVGFTIGYIVPLYPFYRFFFGSLQWIMVAFEALVSIPLFALAHVNPYGDGISGGQAQYGYSVLLQLILRPILMVFGLVAGFLLFSVALSFLNMAFLVVAEGTGNLSGGVPALAKLIYSVLYAVMVVILANECFSTVGIFPQAALRWLGKQQVAEEKYANVGMLTAGAAAIANKASSNMTALGQVAGNAIGKKTKKKLEQDSQDRLIKGIRGES